MPKQKLCKAKNHAEGLPALIVDPPPEQDTRAGFDLIERCTKCRSGYRSNAEAASAVVTARFGQAMPSAVGHGYSGYHVLPGRTASNAWGATAAATLAAAEAIGAETNTSVGFAGWLSRGCGSGLFFVRRKAGARALIVHEPVKIGGPTWDKSQMWDKDQVKGARRGG